MSSKRRATHATKACNSCRRRRCKCDGIHPVCGTCAFYGHECTWSQEEDARRPATKQLVESLRVRIRELESEVAQLRGQPSTSAEPVARASAVPSSGSSEHDVVNPEAKFSGRSHLTMQEGKISASGPTSMWSTFPVDESLEKPSAQIHPFQYEYIFRCDPTIPLHLLPRGAQLSAQCEWDRYLPKHIDEFDRLEHDILLERCFSFHTPWMRGVEPDHFLRDMLTQLTPGFPQGNSRVQNYSGFLHCALMAFATAFSDKPKIRSKEIRKLFLDYAKQYLESECGRPTLTAVQATTFLSDCYGGLGERGLAYLYFGMSCRLVRALGLCIDCRPWVESGRITPQELVTRDWLFWSTFCQDKIMSLDYGRDYDIPLPHLNVNLPTIDNALDAKPWDGTAYDRAQPNMATLAFFEGCKLMLIAVRIMDTIYSQGRQNWRVTEKDNVSQIHLLLDSWYNNLPEHLLVSTRSGTRPLPHIITLNLAYWWLLLILHRPFYARTQRSASNASNESPPTSFTELSVKLCDRAANKIVTLVMLFDRSYGLKYFPLGMLQVIFIAGATLLVQSATLSESAVKKRADAHDATRKCIRALQVTAQTWECAHVIAMQLQNLLQEQTGESPIQATYSLQTLSAESSPINHHSTLPGPGDLAGQMNHPHPPHWHNSHTAQPTLQYPPTIDPALMFRQFVSEQSNQLELGYAINAPTSQVPYRGLHELHQQPLMGMPSGSEFVMNPHVLPLPHDPNYRQGGYPEALDVEYYHNQQEQQGTMNPGQG